MASYKKTKTGWSVRVSRRENGKLRQVFKSGFATKNEAKAFAQEIESAESIGKRERKHLRIILPNGMRRIKAAKLPRAPTANTGTSTKSCMTTSPTSLSLI